MLSKKGSEGKRVSVEAPSSLTVNMLLMSYIDYWCVLVEEHLKNE